MKTFILLAAIMLCAVSLTNAYSLDNGLARTPPMGWNSWNKFACDVNEQLIREMADAMVTSGMKDAGYVYLVIDDCWQIDRDAQGNILPDPQRFPSGMKALADYVHSKGLKFGLYSDAGTLTCQKRPGSRGYEFQDARQYAAWGVDYLKYDWCSTGTQNAPASYSIMRDALLKAGRPIVFSICEWGTSKPWLWAKDVGNLWRTTGDIQDCWDCKRDWGGMGVVHILDLQDGLESYAGPGHWNDPDMLEVGNKGMTITEYRAHFSLWCILAAPLMAGNDLRNMTNEVKEILTNREVIAVDQDSLGMQGRRVKRDGDREVWAKQLADGGRAVVLFNRGPKSQEISVSWTEIGYPQHVAAQVRDLWAHKDLGKLTGRFSAEVPSHGVVMVTVKP
ncbi:MAG TPA: alpha-galactosidase [Pyrinomonadaceae bacterium]|nr:alpha-galactosidase [Pyrinomonadaceae bacterium]